MRHTHAAELAEEGHPINLVQALLGHSPYIFLPLPSSLPQEKLQADSRVSTVYAVDGSPIGEFKEAESRAPRPAGRRPRSTEAVAPSETPGWSPGSAVASRWVRMRVRMRARIRETDISLTPRWVAIWDAGRTAEFLGEVVDGSHDDQVVLLEAAWRSDPPRVVADVALELPEDGDPGEDHEGPFPPRVEAVHGVDEGEASDLDEVLGRFPLAGEPPRQTDGKAVVMSDQLRPQARVPGLGVHDLEPARFVVAAPRTGLPSYPPRRAGPNRRLDRRIGSVSGAVAGFVVENSVHPTGPPQS